MCVEINAMDVVKKQYLYFEIFWKFFQLGCYSFGGPAAHLVFFHQRFVQQLRWIDEQHYAQYLALAQILPGPTSSQLGIAIGYAKGRYLGACCAWLGFTLPSALLMTVVALVGGHYFEYIPEHVFHVIHLIVLAVVLWAFWQMMRSFCQQLWQYAVMVAATVFLYFSSFATAHMILIVAAAVIGLALAKIGFIQPSIQPVKTLPNPCKTQKTTSAVWLVLFGLPFMLLPALYYFDQNHAWLMLFDLYQTASLVFGGGHVILPLMHQDFVANGLLNAAQFDLGYAITQLMPGPLFSFASYIGALLPITPSATLSAILATIMIFLPSFLLMFAALPYWSLWVNQPRIASAVSAINAAVVGLLLCLLLELSQTAIRQLSDVIFVAVVVALLRTKLPIWLTLLGSYWVYSAVMYWF